MQPLARFEGPMSLRRTLLDRFDSAGAYQHLTRSQSFTRYLRQLRNLIPRDGFNLVLTFYQREQTYSLALAAISGFVKRELPDVRAYLVTIVEGDSIPRFVDNVCALKPDLIAISCMSPTWRSQVPYLDALEERLPETPVVVGGYQAILSPEETIAHPAVDYVCVGDGERSVTQLIRHLRHPANGNGHLPGLWKKKAGGEVVRAEPDLAKDLSEMPFPDYSIFEMDGDLKWLSPHAIESKKLTTLPVITGRGCPNRCSYCSNTTLLGLFRSQGPYLRKYDIEKLIEELDRLKHRYAVQYFQFMDEMFLYNIKYSLRFFELYADRIHLPFSIFAHVERMDKDLCCTAAKAGCHSMWFGVESGSESYRRHYLNRAMSNELIMEAAENARQCGIRRLVFNMIGMPFETPSDMWKTLELTRKIRPELTVYGQYLPLPGTPLYGIAKDNDLLLDPSENRQMWSLGNLNIKEHPGGATARELTEVVEEIMCYLSENNRYDD